jgi:hypothetical protein
MNKQFGILLALIGSLIMASCSTRKPEFREIKNVKLNKIGLKSTTLTLDVVMYNPNPFALELTETDLDILINNTLLGHSGQRYKIKIPGKANFIVPIMLEADSKQLLKNGFNALVNKKIELRAKGAVRLGKSGIYKTVKVDYAGTHEISLSELF